MNKKTYRVFTGFMKSFLISFLFLFCFAAGILLWIFLPKSAPVRQTEPMTVYLPENDEAITLLVAGRDTRVDTADKFYLMRYQKSEITVFPVHGKSFTEINGKAFNLSKFYDYGGAGMALLAVEKIFGIKIDRYIRTDIDSTARIADFLGGMIYDLEREIRYENNNSQIYLHLNPGRQTLDGLRFAAVMRSGENNFLCRNKDIHRCAPNSPCYDDINLLNWRASLLSEFLGQAISRDISRELDGLFDLLLSVDGNLSEYDLVRRKNGLETLIAEGSLTIKTIEVTGDFAANGTFRYSSQTLVDVSNSFG
ncbi:MAG: LCP family protein [Oscillospiraceae bacterium]|nr:LCP family protein [Oscillospiraceae bacterium]